jgi:hypothetical protein
MSGTLPLNTGRAAQVIAEWSQPVPTSGGKFTESLVFAHRKTLLKIVRKHLLDQAQPWARVLPGQLFHDLSASMRSVQQSCSDTLLIELALIIGQWARESADKPRIFQCRQRRAGTVEASSSPALHLARCGAYIVIANDVPPGRDQPPASVLRACFFGTPHPVDQPPGNAWRTMAQRVIWRWAKFDARFGAFRIHPDDHVRTVPQEAGHSLLRWQPRFISEENWGIRELADGSHGFRSLPTGAW